VTKQKSKEAYMKHLIFILWTLLFCHSLFAIEIYGHRGAAGLAPENTLEAYRTALDIGVDVIDMDVGLTQDGIVVVYHNTKLNPDITRLPSGEWITKEYQPLKRLSYKALRAFNVGQINPSSKYAKSFPLQQSKAHEHIPTLREVIQYAKKRDAKVRFQIEIKTNPLEPNISPEPAMIVPAIIKVLREEGITNKTEIHSFDWANLLLLEKLAPEVTRSYLTANEYNSSAAAGAWTAGNLPSNQRSIPTIIKALNGHIWCPDFNDVNASDIKAAHDLGLKVTVWSVDKPEDMLRMIQYGVDGIITNRPDLLRGLLAAKNLVKSTKKLKA
jgi:glycerophosphoryl diester phosphodiesterase